MLQVRILVLRIRMSRSQYATGRIHVYTETGCRLRRRRERERKSAAPQKQEGCLSKRRESDGAGAVSQSVYTDLLVVSSKHKSDYVDSTYRITGFNCDSLIIANCEFISSSQKIETQN